MTNEKEPGKMFAELWFSANCWSSLDHEEREQCAKLESAIRADERAKTVEECAMVAETVTFPDVSNPVEEAIVKGAKVCAKNIASHIRALTEKKDG